MAKSCFGLYYEHKSKGRTVKKMVKMLQGGRTAAPARTRAEKRARGRQRRRRVLTKLNQSKSLYGGCMMDIGCHGMDLIHTVAGSSIEEVFALHLSPRDEKRREEFGERANLNGVENTAILNYRLASGATVFHEVFWTQVAQTNRFEMEIYGAKGVIYLYNPHRSDIVYYGWNLDGHPRKDIHWQVAPVDPQFFGYIHHKTFVDDLLNGTNNSKPCAGTGHAGLCLAVRDRAQQEHAAPPDGRRRCRDRGRAGHCGKRDGKRPYAHGVHRAAFGRRRNLAREALAFRGGKNSCRRAGQRL